MKPIDCQTEPSKYRHWKLEFDGEIANLIMDVDPAGGLSTDYELKLNSYDLSVDIELNDVSKINLLFKFVHFVIQIKSSK